jgi:hypothetical protein
MPDPVKQPTVREYFLVAGKLWCEEISGPILAVVSIVLILAYAHYSDNANATAKLVKYSAWLTGTISILLIFVAQYKAWRDERNAMNKEKVRQVGADIRGNIERGYLDLRTFHESPNNSGEFTVLTGGCSVKFYIETVNYNDWGTWFKPRESKLELRIGKACFHGTWEHVDRWLAVHDESVQEKRLADIFDSLPSHRLQHGFPFNGHIGFSIPEFDRTLLKNKTEISAAVTILIVDSLEKIHSIEGNDVKLLIDRLRLITEIGSQK